jgi:hypothetical protein
MSGLHAWRTARAPERICAIAPDVQSSMMAPVTTTPFFNKIDPPLLLPCLDCAAVSFHQDYSRKTSSREAEPAQSEKDCCCIRPARTADLEDR